jgi:hypothetical protein
LVTLNDEIDEFPDKGTGEEGRFVMIKKVFKEHPIKIIFAFLCILLFIGLEIWDDHAPLSIHNWNKKEISRIKIADPDNFTFAVFGDNKGNYSFFEPLLSDVAQDKEIAFAMDLGDLVGDGRRGQYRRFLNQVQKNVAIPFLTAIGNHDLENGSNNNYQETFGPTYYAFQVGQCCFIVLDASKGSGFDRTERQWVEGELRKAQDIYPPSTPEETEFICKGKAETTFWTFSDATRSPTSLLPISMGISQARGRASLIPSRVEQGPSSRETTRSISFITT